MVVHTRDLRLCDTTIKMGFGLWNYRALTFFLELAVLGAGVALYLHGSRPPRPTRLIVLITVLFVLHLYNFFAPAPPNIQVMAVSAETAYWALAALAWWADRRTSPRLRSVGGSISLSSKGLPMTVQRFLVAVQCNQRPFDSLR